MKGERHSQSGLGQTPSALPVAEPYGARSTPDTARRTVLLTGGQVSSGALCCGGCVTSTSCAWCIARRFPGPM